MLIVFLRASFLRNKDYVTKELTSNQLLRVPGKGSTQLWNSQQRRLPASVDSLESSHSRQFTPIGGFGQVLR